jgi:hypothetical protein
MQRDPLDHLGPSHFCDSPALLSPKACARVLGRAEIPEPLDPDEPGISSSDAQTRRAWANATKRFPGFTVIDHKQPEIEPVKKYLKRLNRSHWNLPRTGWHCTVSSYRPGAYFPEHVDFDPERFEHDVPALTFAASVLLVGPRSFGGGRVYVDDQRMPKRQGVPVAFHGFVPHDVEQITSGTRYALNVFATFGTIGEALSQGWPTNWLTLDQRRPAARR